MKEILFGIESLQKLQNGVEKISKTVKLTLGPKGRNVALERKFSVPLITNDGVTIAKEIELTDPYENLGADLLKQACIKTNDIAGDGTTTACVLTESIVKNGIKNIVAGSNPVLLKKGIKLATKYAIEELKNISTPINNNEEIFNIARISAQDEEIGNLIKEAFIKVGKNGVINVEDNKSSMETTLSSVNGLDFDRGFVSPYMATDTIKMQTIFNNAHILITDRKINNLQEIIGLLEQCSTNGYNLIIIADDFEVEVINTLVVNKLRGALNVVAIKAPFFADKKTATLKDIAILTNGKFISKDLDDDLKDVNLSDLGTADLVRITASQTIIQGGAGAKSEAMTTRIAEIKSQLNACDNDFDKTKMAERLARLTSGISVIYVGSATEVEMQEKKLRIEDAISATKSAVEEGIVAGGGVALLTVANKIKNKIALLIGDEKTGAEILVNSLYSPIKTIAENSGINGDVVIENILKSNKQNYGYNALKNTYCDMLLSGIIDPTKVTRSALENASSVASTLLLCESLVIEKEKSTN